MQSVSSKIWTRVAVSISYDDNDYTTGTSSVFALSAAVDNLFIFSWYQVYLLLTPRETIHCYIRFGV